MTVRTCTFSVCGEGEQPRASAPNYIPVQSLAPPGQAFGASARRAASVGRRRLRERFLRKNLNRS